MDGLTLLRRAREAGIDVRASGERLQVRGPKQHAALVKQLFEHKAELLRHLRAEPAVDWLVERNLGPESVAEAFRRYLAETSGGQMPELPQGTLLSRFNLWLEAHGRRPTTLPVLRRALGEHSQSAASAPSYLAKRSKCGGTDWGPSGRYEADGAEVWGCLRCTT